MLLLLAIAASGPVWGAPVTTIRNNGGPANRVDLAILGDGYTATELTKFATDAENAVIGFFNQEPFREYNRYFNVHRVDVISAESGADHPERDPPVFVDTAFDATYNCGNVQRLICVSSSKVFNVLSNSVTPSQRDMILVIVNDPEYGGSGGAVAVASTNSSVVDLVLHELGHSFGLLADEYCASPPTCNNTTEPPEPNVTRETQPSLIKWNFGGGPPTGWIEFGTPIPTTTTTPGVPGLYEGAKYCTVGLYRPTYNSKMRSLGPPFEQINEEQFVKRIYNLVSPLDSSSPPNPSLVLVKGETQRFTVTVPAPATHTLTTTWIVDGLTVGSGQEFILDSATLPEGTHSVEVLVRDWTPKVRYDPAQVLTERRIWSVEVVLQGAGSVPDGRNPQSMPLTVQRDAAGDLVLTWGPSCDGNDTDYEIYEGPMEAGFTSHAVYHCSTGGATTVTIVPASASTYYLIVPRNAYAEGSYGPQSDGSQRPPASSACLPQKLSACQ